MSDHKEARVLGRCGARELSIQETSQISGGFSTQKLTGTDPKGRLDVVPD